MNNEDLNNLVDEMTDDQNRFNLSTKGIIAVYLLAIYKELVKANEMVVNKEMKERMKDKYKSRILYDELGE